MLRKAPVKWFRTTETAEYLSSVRRFETRDIARRLGYISPAKVRLINFPVERPVSVFNAAATLKGDQLSVYLRVIIGYYRYVSSIAEVSVPVQDVLRGEVSRLNLDARIVVVPDTKYDFWGAEDPRTSLIDGTEVMVYTGRTVTYFPEGERPGRAKPVIAVRRGGEWVKVAVATPPKQPSEHIESDKDAFIFRVGGKNYIFHRVKFVGGGFHTLISELGEVPGEGLKELVEFNTREVMKTPDFEYKMGWGTPLAEVGPNKYVTLLHGVDGEMTIYRVFAALVEYVGRELEVTSVTPFYVMEPKEVYEVYGDRPFVLFPCGLVRVDNELLVIYGAADYVVGFASLDVDELVGILERVALR